MPFVSCASSVIASFFLLRGNLGVYLPTQQSAYVRQMQDLRLLCSVIELCANREIWYGDCQAYFGICVSTSATLMWTVLTACGVKLSCSVGQSFSKLATQKCML